MNSVATTYHGFHQLPKGVKMMLLESELFFFCEPHGHAKPAVSAPAAISALRYPAFRFASPAMPHPDATAQSQPSH